MRRFSTHGKLLALLSALLLAPLAVAAATGFGLLADQASDQVSDAYDRVVPGMTRADDLASLGFDTHAARIADNQTVSSLKGPAAHDCVAADQYCTGYVFRGGVVLLVMDGRVIDKVFTRA
jgi:hypothetical protein